MPAMPLLPDHDSLRRREAQYLAGAEVVGSGSAMDLPTQSSSFLSESASYPTQSNAGPYYPISPTPTAPYFPLQTGSPPAGPELFTGKAPELASYPVLYILVSVLSLYLTF